MVFRGAWLQNFGYQTNDAVTFNGSTYIALTTNSGSEPDLYPGIWAVLAQQGGAGPTGATGAAATLSIGTVTTTAPGTPATITNSGTSAAAILNFTLPQGAAGTSGGGSGTGSGSLLAVSMYHAVSFSFTYYALNNTNSSVDELPSVLTWVPTACTATNLSVYSQQGNSITVTLRQGTPGNMASTTLSCLVASNAACTVTGSVTVSAGSFLDLTVTGANGTPSGVWTALICS